MLLRFIVLRRLDNKLRKHSHHMRKLYKCLKVACGMEEYTLKNYQKGFEDDQAKVGIEVAQSWKYAHQTSADRLKEIYSLPEFDPETRHYCFEKDKMVGFLTSKVIEPKEDGKRRASLVFPSVLPGYEKAADLLIEKAFETLKKKDVEVVETYVSAISGNNYDLAKKWDYKHIQDIDNIVFILNGWEIKADLDTSKIRKFDHEKDFDKWLSLVKEYDGLTDEQTEQLVKELKNEQDNIVAHLVIEEDEEIVGTTMIFRNEIKPSTANLAYTYVTNAEYLKMLATKVKEIGVKKDIDMFFIWLFRGRLKLRKYFDELNFKYGQPSAALFEKELK